MAPSLYRTTDAKGNPEATVTTLVLPETEATSGEMPLVSYQTAEDSLGTQCAPSYTLRTGTEKEEPAIMQPLLRGWAVVVPDYEGPESQYGAGAQAGQAVLDSIRAAKNFEQADLGPETDIGVWGYSGGGLASAWANELQPAYAPDVEISGVAAGGVPPDVEAVARQIDGGPFAGIMFAASIGIDRAYPEMELESLLNDTGRDLVESMQDDCVGDSAQKGAFKSMEDHTRSDIDDPLELPQVDEVLQKNHLGKATPEPRRSSTTPSTTS